MSNKVNIAIDAMSGENAPQKIIEGIEISLRKNKDNFFLIYGDQNILEKEVSKGKLVKQHSKIIHSNDVI